MIFMLSPIFDCILNETVFNEKRKNGAWTLYLCRNTFIQTMYNSLLTEVCKDGYENEINGHGRDDCIMPRLWDDGNF